MNRYYAVYSNNGYLCPETVRNKRHESIEAFIASYGLTWHAWRYIGARVKQVEVRIREPEKVPR